MPDTGKKGNTPGMWPGIGNDNRFATYALEHSTVAFFLIDENANILKANDAASAQTGWTLEELVEMTVHDIDPEFPREAWQGHWEQLKKEKFLRFESTHARKDQTSFPAEIETNYVEFDGQGYNFAFARDITERKQLAEERSKKEAELEAQVDERTKQLEFQRKAAQHLALDANAARTRAIEAERELADFASELALPQGNTDFKSFNYKFHRLTLNDVMTCGRMIRAICKEHVSLWSFANHAAEFIRTQFVDEFDEPVFGLILLHSTKPSNELDTQQQAAVEAYQPGLDNSDPCLILEAASADERWEPHASQFTKAYPLLDPAPGEEIPPVAHLLYLLGCNLPFEGDSGTLLHHDDSAALHIPDASLPNWPKSHLEPLVRDGLRTVIGFGQELGDGTHFTLTAYAYTPLSPDHVNLFVHLSHSLRIGLLHFATHRRRTITQIHAVDALLRGHEAFATEQEERLLDTMSALQIANKELRRSNEELDQFAFAASHDLKSPLFGIQNLVGLIEEETGSALSSKALKYFTKLSKRVSHLDALLDAMLSFSRVGYVEDTPSEESISQLLTQVLSLLNVPRGVSIHIPAHLPRIKAPKGALLRVFANLISNAIKHGGKPNLDISVSWEEKLDFHAFKVEDNGIGIDTKHHTRVFQMFKTLKPTNLNDTSGMGLALVKKTIEHHGGTITLDSRPNVGTSFTFTWPKERQTEL